MNDLVDLYSRFNQSLLRLITGIAYTSALEESEKKQAAELKSAFSVFAQLDRKAAIQTMAGADRSCAFSFAHVVQTCMRLLSIEKPQADEESDLELLRLTSRQVLSFFEGNQPVVSMINPTQLQLLKQVQSLDVNLKKITATIRNLQQFFAHCFNGKGINGSPYCTDVQVVLWYVWLELGLMRLLLLHAQKNAQQIAPLSVDLKHKTHLYEEGDPLISDQDYDCALSYLALLERLHVQQRSIDSATQTIGGKKDLSLLKTIAHLEPMLSLANAFSHEEAYAFDKRLHRYLDLPFDEPIAYSVEHKLDGVGVNLQYINQRLIHAVSRGDGTRGEDLTDCIKNIKGVPMQLPKDAPSPLEVRAEAIFLRKDFREKVQGEYKNPRNAVAGLLRLKDAGRIKNYPIMLLCYRLFVPQKTDFEHFSAMKQLKKWGFQTGAPTQLVCGIDACLEQYHQAEKARTDVPYDIDGLVYKVNRGDWQRRLGFAGRSLRWAIAHKFKAEEASAQILDIDLQVGRTGNITPVARLEPVNVAGVTISNVSLHNFTHIEELKLSVKDRVLVRRAGEVIPEIVEVIASFDSGYKKRPDKSSWKAPLLCPSCQGRLAWRDVASGQESRIMYCPASDNCKPQIIGRLQHYCSRHGMHIEGFGNKILTALVDAQQLRTPADFYTLNIDQLCNMERIGSVLAQKLLRNVAASRNCELHRLIYALGLPEIGSETSAIVAGHFQSMKNLMQAEEEEFKQIPKLGIRTQAVVQFFRENRSWIDRLLKKLNVSAQLTESRGLLTGYDIVVSGKFADYGRLELSEKLRKLGAQVRAQVTKDTNLLLLGNKPSAHKVKKAEQHNLQTINSAQINFLLEGNLPAAGLHPNQINKENFD